MQKTQLKKTQTNIAVTNERIKAARLTSKLTKQNWWETLFTEIVINTKYYLDL